MRTPDQFWSQVVKSDGCWLWQGHVINSGYGAISWDGRVVLAHRLSWEMANGPIPPKLLVCHVCDVRLCVRPDHLFLGTTTDNILDSVKKRRWNRPTALGREEATALKLEWNEGVLELDALAAKYGVDRSTAYNVIRGVSWADIDIPRVRRRSPNGVHKDGRPFRKNVVAK